MTPDANVTQLSYNLFGDHVFAFELTGVLLVVAVAGTVVLTRRERRAQAVDRRSSSAASALAPEER